MYVGECDCLCILVSHVLFMCTIFPRIYVKNDINDSGFTIIFLFSSELVELLCTVVFFADVYYSM